MTNELKIISKEVRALIADAAKEEFAHIGAVAGRWEKIARGCCGGTGTGIKELVEQSRDYFVFDLCVLSGFGVEVNAKGQLVLTEAYKAKATVEQGEQFKDCKARARSNFGVNILRGYAYAKLLPHETGNQGGKKAKVDAPAPDAPAPDAPVPGLAVNAQFREVERLMLHFMASTKLTKADKESAGTLADAIRKLGDALNEPAPKA